MSTAAEVAAGYEMIRLLILDLKLQASSYRHFEYLRFTVTKHVSRPQT